MTVQFINSRPMFGPLSEHAMTEILSQVSSIQQFQQIDPHTVLFITANEALRLDYAAVLSLTDYLLPQHGHSYLYQALLMFQNRMSPRPKPEPEVERANVRATLAPLPEPEPEPEAVPRWKARVQTKLRSGRVFEDTHLIEEISDLQRIVEDVHYWDDIKNIKIKLEFLG